MSKRLRKIVSILCLVSMLFGNLSLESFIGDSGRIVKAEQEPASSSFVFVNDKMEVGNTKKGTINAGETYSIRLTAKKGKVLTLEADGMKLWVDVVNEQTGDTSRYTTKDGVLQVKWVAKTNSYLLIFGAQQNGASGNFTVSVTAEGENTPAAENSEATSEPSAAEVKQEEEKPDSGMEQKPEETPAEEKNQSEISAPTEDEKAPDEEAKSLENKESVDNLTSDIPEQKEADSGLKEEAKEAEPEEVNKQEEAAKETVTVPDAAVDGDNGEGQKEKVNSEEAE